MIQVQPQLKILHLQAQLSVVDLLILEPRELLEDWQVSQNRISLQVDQQTKVVPIQIQQVLPIPKLSKPG